MTAQCRFVESVLTEAATPGDRPATSRGPAAQQRRKLTDEEVHRIAKDLADQARQTSDPITVQDVEQMINDSVLQQASDEDVTRVSARLAAGGWPLADPPRD
jgi:hypothetical protein